MELMYFWINTSDNGILKKQDVMLSSEYEITYDGKKYLNIKKNNNYYNIFENDVISNVNAIVGSNGAGKTTLLQYIYTRNVQPYIKFEGEELSAYDMNFCNSRITIQVYKEKTKLLVIHNVKNGIEVTGSESPEIINTYDNHEKSSLDEIIPITKIYLTNSSYNNGINGYSSAFGEPTDIALTMQSIATFSSSFYNNIVNFPERGIEDNWYNGLQQIIISKRNEDDFQQICDLIYFNKLYKNGTLDSFLGKISTKLALQVKSLLSILNESKNSQQPINRYSSNMNYGERIRERIDKWKEVFLVDILLDYPNNINMIEQLETNLILELDFIYKILDNEKTILKENILAVCLNHLNSIDHNEGGGKKDYYINAIKEINELKDVLKEADKSGDIIVDYNVMKEEYLKFCEYIKEIVERKESFLLKYLSISNLGMSSGERAYLNFFSWLNLLTFFGKVSNHSALVDTKDNILLLVDEVDLYCHPEWQRKMVKNILDELKIQFADKKIQVIFTTHSPIVLSDISLTNTLYIKAENGRTKIDSRELHSQTFGANIYDLYKNAFFFKKEKYIGIIGEFALDKLIEVENKLDDWISIFESVQKETVKDNLHSEDIKAYNEKYFWKEIARQYGEKYNKKNINIILECSKKIIELIGEPVIKDMIKKKYNIILRELYKVRYNNNDSDELMDAKIKYDKLSNKDSENLIKYIIEQNNEVE